MVYWKNNFVAVHDISCLILHYALVTSFLGLSVGHCEPEVIFGMFGLLSAGC